MSAEIFRKSLCLVGLLLFGAAGPLHSEENDLEREAYEASWLRLMEARKESQHLLDLMSASDWFEMESSLKSGESSEDLKAWIEAQGEFEPVFKALRSYTAPRRQKVSDTANHANARKTISEEAVEKQYDWFLQHREHLEDMAERTRVNPEILAAICYAETRLSEYRLPHLAVDAVFTLNGLLENGILSNEEDQRDRLKRLKRLARASLLSLWRFERDHGFAVRKIRSSWAGAVGPMQLMPFNFYHLSDGDGDGIVDPENMLDSLTGAASFLKAKGWGARQNWLFRQNLNDAELVGILLKYNSSTPYAEGVLEAAKRLRALILKKEGESTLELIPMGASQE